MIDPIVYAYEFKKNIFYFIMSTHPVNDRAPIPVDFISMDINATPKEIGEKAIEAINRFSFDKSDVMEYQTDIIHKNICSWVGARGIKSFEKNYRFLTIENHQKEKQFIITPFDNFNKFQYQWAFNKDVIKVQCDCTEEEFGRAILTGFQRSTYHPERKDPKYKESNPVFRLP
jgi:hypothetical protein